MSKNKHKEQKGAKRAKMGNKKQKREKGAKKRKREQKREIMRIKEKGTNRSRKSIKSKNEPKSKMGQKAK